MSSSLVLFHALASGPGVLLFPFLLSWPPHPWQVFKSHMLSSDAQLCFSNTPLSLNSGFPIDKPSRKLTLGTWYHICLHNIKFQFTVLHVPHQTATVRDVGTDSLIHQKSCLLFLPAHPKAHKDHTPDRAPLPTELQKPPQLALSSCIFLWQEWHFLNGTQKTPLCFALEIKAQPYVWQKKPYPTSSTASPQFPSCCAVSFLNTRNTGLPLLSPVSLCPFTQYTFPYFKCPSSSVQLSRFISDMHST